MVWRIKWLELSQRVKYPSKLTLLRLSYPDFNRLFEKLNLFKLVALFK